LKKSQIPKDFEKRVADLFEGDLQAPLRQSQEMALIQSVVLTYNDKQLDKARPKQVIFLTTSAIRALNTCLSEAHKAGIDVFSPTDGRLIKLEPYQPEGLPLTLFRVSLLDPYPLKEEICKKLWVDWDKALKRQTFDEHIVLACKCFGRDIVELAFPDDVARVMANAPAVDVADDLPGVTDVPAAAAEAPAADPAPQQYAPPPVDIDTELPSDSLGDEEPEEAPTPPPAAAPEGASAQSPEALQDRYQALLDESSLDLPPQ
jgi:hypothetical protein